MTDANERAQFARDGRMWLRDVVPYDELELLRTLSGSASQPGARVLANDPLFRVIASGSVTKTIQSIWPEMRPVRLVSFDKNAAVNWGVPWHQDRVIAVKTKAELPGFSNWSRKQGTWHCEPPASVFDEMLFVRVHLDRSTEVNGAMEISLGSHHSGKAAAASANAIAKSYPAELTIAEPGDVLVLPMLTLHRSLPAGATGERRVLRIDYAQSQLPEPLDWAV